MVPQRDTFNLRLTTSKVISSSKLARGMQRLPCWHIFFQWWDPLNVRHLEIDFRLVSKSFKDAQIAASPAIVSLAAWYTQCTASNEQNIPQFPILPCTLQKLLYLALYGHMVRYVQCTTNYEVHTPSSSDLAIVRHMAYLIGFTCFNANTPSISGRVSHKWGQSSLWTNDRHR